MAMLPSNCGFLKLLRKHLSSLDYLYLLETNLEDIEKHSNRLIFEELPVTFPTYCNPEWGFLKIHLSRTRGAYSSLKILVILMNLSWQEILLQVGYVCLISAIQQWGVLF